MKSYSRETKLEKPPIKTPAIYQKYERRVYVGDAGFEHGTSAPEVCRDSNEPPHLLLTCFRFLDITGLVRY